MRNLAVYFRLLMAAFLLCASAQQALAQKVLLLTTNVSGPNAEKVDAIAAYDNLQAEFASQLASPADLTRLSVLGDAGAISQATFTAPSGAPYDIVIVAATYKPVQAGNWDVLQSAVANRWANSIVFFVDGCCEAENNQNAQHLVATLNTGAGAGFALGSPVAGFARFPLNTNSPFAPSFSGLNPFAGGDITYINNVPANNALYLATGTPPGSFPAPGTSPVNSVYGLLIPTSESNSGNGACVFAVVDVSPFIAVGASYPTWTENQGKVAPAFLKAATSETGACGLPKVGKSFDKTDLYLAGGDNQAVLTISLSNGTPNAINGVNLTDHLPAPMVVGAGSVSNTCTAGSLSAAVGANAVSNSGFTIPSGGCTITVPVQWPDTDAGRQACRSTPSVTNTITPGTDFVSPTGQVNTPATASLACHTPDVPVIKPAEPVPALDSGKLALMVAALALLGMWALRRTQHR